MEDWRCVWGSCGGQCAPLTSMILLFLKLVPHWVSKEKVRAVTVTACCYIHDSIYILFLQK